MRCRRSLPGPLAPPDLPLRRPAALALAPLLALVALLPTAPLRAQAGPAGTAAPELPALGEPAPVPEGAPPHLALVDREDLRQHAYWLADDVRAGRYTTSPGQVATAEYVAAHFERLSLKPLGDRRRFLQAFPLERTWLDRGTSLRFGSHTVKDHFAVLPAGGDKVQLSGRFQSCGGGRADELPASLEGRIPVVALQKVPRGTGAMADLQAIQLYVDIARRLGNAGAKAGVVALEGDPGSWGNTLNYHGLQPEHPRLRMGGGGRPGIEPAVPLFVVGGPVAAELLAWLGEDPEKARRSGRLQIAVRTDDKAVGTNVVALLEGTDSKHEAVVFSAHHDHVGRRVDGDAFNGADDNASGTAALLEIAEAFAKGGDAPSRSIVFLSVSGEELGLWGSEWFRQHPSWPLDRIVANVNIDMIGRAVPDGEGTRIQVTPSRGHDAYSTLVRDAVPLARRLGIAFESGDAYYERSDHYNFARAGIPVVFFCDGEHPDYHQVSDHADRLDYPRLEAVARLAFWTGWQVAQAEGRPTRLGSQADW